MKPNWKRSLVLGLAILMTVSMVLAGCSKATPTPAPATTAPTTTGGGSTTPTPAPTTAAPTTPAVTPTPVPSAPVKISVMQWDRGNQPAGWSQEASWLYRFVKEENRKQYVEVEFAMVPRSGSDTNIKTLYAAQSNPTIIYSYEFSVMSLMADEGGLWAVDGYVETYAADLKAKNAAAYEQTSGAVYRGHQYFVPGFRTQPYGGASFVIRQDWLDELSLPMPTTTEELYNTLIAFRDGTPGVTDASTVMPWALQAPTGWFLYHMGECFGMSSTAPLTGWHMKGGVIKDGQFTPAVMADEFANMAKFVNRAYKDGLIDREMITDTAYERYNMFFARALTGFTESNNDGWTWTQKGIVADPNTRFVNMDPLFLEDGTQASIAQTSAMGMYLMIPKATATEEQMIAALKYMNWQSSVGWEYIFNGLEGVHFAWVTTPGGERYRVVDYTKISATQAQRDIDLWSAGDMVFVQQGQGYDTYEVMVAKQKVATSQQSFQETYSGQSDYEALAVYIADQAQTKRILHETFGVAAPISMEPRPLWTEKAGDLQDYVNDGLAQLMLAATDAEFESKLTELRDGYVAKGGLDVAAEAEVIMRGWGLIS